MAAFCVVFPAFDMGLREADPEFHREVAALDGLGIPWRVVNLGALMRGDIAKALKFFGPAPCEPLLYRGWIVHPAEFALLHDALRQHGCRLLISPVEYQRALLFPEFYPAIEEHSFPAAWTMGKNTDRVMRAARRLGPPPYFIKDYAKSAKEIWPEGCAARSEEELAAAVEALVAFRGDRFEQGIVVRPLIQLRCLGENPFGGNIFEEYRLFFFRGRMIAKSAYDRIGGDVTRLPDYGFLPSRIRSPFFTADVVVTAEGKPLLLEVGDGGSSALPPGIPPADFYAAICHECMSSQLAD